MNSNPQAMQLALHEARLAATRNEVPVGAVIFDGHGHLLSSAGNRTIELHDPTAHAEILAIRAAAAMRGSERLVDCVMYVTLEPCAMCAAALSLAKFKRVVFAAEDAKMGGVLHGPRFFEQPTCHHRPEVVSGVGERESVAMLKDFFSARR